MISFSSRQQNGQGLAAKLMRAVMGSAVVQLGGAVFSFLLSILLARYLKPEGLGLFSMAWATVMILAIVAQLGLSQLATREVAATTARKDFRRAKGVILGFPGAIAVSSISIAVLIYITLKIYRPENFYVWVQVLFAFPLMALIGSIVGILRGLHNPVISQSFESVIRPALFILLLTAFYFLNGHLGVRNAVFLMTMTLAIILVTSGLILFKLLPGEIAQARPSFYTRQWRRAAWPMLGMELTQKIFSQFPFLLLGTMAGLQDAGIYRVAYALAILQGMPISVLAFALMSHMASLHACGEREKLQRMFSVAAGIAFSSTLVAAVVFFFIGKPMISIFYGTEYLEAWPLLMLLTLAGILRGFFGPVASLLNMTGEEKTVRNAFMINLALAVGLSAALLPFLGIIALPLAIIAAEMVNQTLLWLRARKKLHINASALSLVEWLSKRH